MSRLKNMSRGSYIVVGFVMAMLLVPSGVAVAKALKFTGVQGTSGQRADVTAGSQLLATEASPANYYANGDGDFCSACGNEVIALPGSGEALVVKSVDLDTYTLNAPGTFASIFLFVGDSTCANDFVGLNLVNVTSVGNVHLPYEPGLSVAAGEALCAVGGSQTGTLNGTTTVIGYNVPGADVPAAAASSGRSAASALLRRQAAREQLGSH